MDRHPAHAPLVVMYLYVHGQDERFFYPTVRAQASAARVAARYLECALTQAASLRLRDTPCEIALATNVTDPSRLGRDGEQLMARMDELGVRILPTEYGHHPGEDTNTYVSSRYVLDAILTATAGEPGERELWLTDLDCVWADPELVFRNAPPAGEIGCVPIRYEPDWDPVGFGEHGLTRRALGEMAASLGGPGDVPPWIGGELLAGTADALRDLVTVCDEIDERLAVQGRTVPTEEQILTLAGATGRATFRDLSHVARRMSTGPRNHGAAVENPLGLGLWHLPSEKGLSLRRAAQEVRRGRLERLRRDLSDPRRAARRFNVAGTGPIRQIQDDSWIAGQRIMGIAGAALARRA
jgi:hypothetical protein